MAGAVTSGCRTGGFADRGWKAVQGNLEHGSIKLGAKVGRYILARQRQERERAHIESRFGLPEG